MSEQHLLKVSEVAERVRVNQDTVRRWLRTGKLKGTLMGGDRGGYRVAESELLRFIQGGEGSPDQIMPPDRDTTTDARDGART